MKGDYYEAFTVLLCSTPNDVQFLMLVDQCNMSISEGIIVATESCSVALSEEIIVDWEQALNDTCAYYTTSLGIQDEAPQNSTYMIPGGVIDDAEQPVIDNGGSTHSCSAQEVDMIVFCEANYQFILKYYESMLIVQMTDPTFNAWLSAVSLWVSKVRENGDWDYKVSDMFGPYNNPLCAYYDGSYHHITAEYFGNFNYGYTGSLLFGLDILHFGSSAVSGFDAADETDWPAIDDGYYYKTEG